MSIIFVHSFRGGTGKSNITANLAALLAASGMRVGAIDTNLESPGLHFLFGLDDPEPSLNDFLLGKSDIKSAVYDVTATVDPSLKGKILLVPSSTQISEMAQVWNQGVDVHQLNELLQDLPHMLGLDILLVDTNPGLDKESLFSFAVSSGILFISCPDAQDYPGTKIALDVAERLELQNIMLLANKVPPALDLAEAKKQIEQKCDYPVTVVLPHAEEMMNLASAGIFVQHYPEHQITKELKKVAQQLMAGKKSTWQQPATATSSLIGRLPRRKY